jgi:hypothetical protein
MVPEARRDRRLDPLYDDEQKIRAAIEAFKTFARSLDLQHDQMGLVSYSSNATVHHELQCLQSQSVTCTAMTITNTILTTLDSLHASGSTNIADALRLGTDVLSDTNGHYGRPEATHAILLIVDSEPSVIYNVDPICYAQDYWLPNTGYRDLDRAKDCAVYYALQARDRKIALYTITLGYAADTKLMAYIAELTGGFHRHAARPAQLDSILAEINRFLHYRLLD